MNSSKRADRRTLAESDLLQALTELANLRDEERDFERFCTRWPELAHVSADADDLHPIHETLLPPKLWLIFERREKVRALWEGDSTPLKELLLPVDPPEELREEGIYIDRYKEDVQIGILWEAPIELDWRQGKIVYNPRTEFQSAIYALFRQSQLAKVCGNPDCPARFFIARKVIQRYCSDKCAEVFQQEWKRKWWAEHGDEWRRSRRSPKRKSRSEVRRRTMPGGRK